jgi:hypothetical protein
MVGDRWRDIVAGSAAGCLTIFVDYGYEQEGLTTRITSFGPFPKPQASFSAGVPRNRAGNFSKGG